MKKETILAIDQGTTGSTALLFSHSGQICGRAYSEFSQHYPKPGWVEHDAEEIWQVSLQVMKQALDEAGITAHELAGIGITNQRETTVIWDRETGKPVAPAIVWQDRRTAERCAQLKADGHEKMFREKTGLVLDPYFSGTKVAWLLDQDPLLREQAEQGALAFGTIDSWLVWNLTGGAVHATDYSNASRTLLFNLHDLTWDEEILDLLNIPAALLPEVKPSSGIFGETTGDLFGAPIPIAGIAGDQQAALFGQACFEPGMSKNTYGTGCFMLTHTGTKPTEPSEGLLTTIAWGIGDEPVEYAIEGGIFITGAAIQWLRDGLGIIASAEETEEMAKSLDSNEGVYFVPALAGMGTPHWDPYARGTILGITRGTTRAHLVRATLEGIGFQVLDVVEAMEKATGTPIQTLRADGGAVTNGFLMQFQSDLLNVPVEVPSISETTAFGAACLAGLAVGFWKDRAELSRIWQLAEKYKPDMSEKKRKALHRKWLDAVSRARDWAEE